VEGEIMNAWSENRADELRIEVDLIVGMDESFAAQEAKATYLMLVARDVEHWTARDKAMRAAADTLLSRAHVADFRDDIFAAAQWRRQSARLSKAIGALSTPEVA
jgi:hypothetical protein